MENLARAQAMLKEKFDNVGSLHNITLEKLSGRNDIPGELIKEYNRGLDQYESMFKSIELFKDTASSDEALISLINQEIRVLESMENLELDIQKKIDL